MNGGQRTEDRGQVLSGRMACVCMYCGDHYASKPAAPADDGRETHGVCPACFPGAMAEIERTVTFSCRSSQTKPLDALAATPGAVSREATGERTGAAAGTTLSGPEGPQPCRAPAKPDGNERTPGPEGAARLLPGNEPQRNARTPGRTCQPHPSRNAERAGQNLSEPDGNAVIPAAKHAGPGGTNARVLSP